MGFSRFFLSSSFFEMCEAERTRPKSARIRSLPCPSRRDHLLHLFSSTARRLNFACVFDPDKRVYVRVCVRMRVCTCGCAWRTCVYVPL